MTDIKGEKKRAKLYGIRNNVSYAESRYNELAEQLGGVRNLVRKKHDEESCTSVISDSLSQSSSTMSFIFCSQNQVIEPERIVLTDKRSQRTASAMDKHITLERTIKSDLSTVPQRETSSSTRKVAYTNEAASINNIICGLTDSVNKLTNIKAHVALTSSGIFDAGGIKTVQCSLKNAKTNTEAERPYQDNPRKLVPEMSTATVQSKTTKKIKRKIKTLDKQESNKKEADSTAMQNTTKNITKEPETKTFNTISMPNSALLTIGKYKSKTFGKVKAVSSRNLLSKKVNKIKKETKKWNRSEKLVELYHNSQMQFDGTSKDNILLKDVATDTTPEPNRNVNDLNNNFLPSIDENKELDTSPFHRNYALPTIASKMKQVAKNYENFNFRTIPFVAAKSITQSHNLGVNIQQMLSIIKGRKPVTGISATLAHNIGLANDGRTQTLLALVSSIASHMQNLRPCPVDNQNYNYDNLEDIEELPEEENEELHYNNNEIISPSAGAGDKDTRSITGKTWSAEANKNKPKCTCLPKNGANFDEICAKYIPANRATIRQPMNNNQNKKPRSKFGAPPNYSNILKNLSETPIEQKKCKNLKEVLKMLYDDFARLNSMHDDLKYKITNQTLENRVSLLEQLHALEQELQYKEDEITTVMDLHKEVVNLKHQVRTLKKRASQPSIVASPFIRQRPSRETNPANHLAKLLKYVQQFQTSLNSKSNI